MTAPPLAIDAEVAREVLRRARVRARAHHLAAADRGDGELPA
jgi:hypothetical protein